MYIDGTLLLTTSIQYTKPCNGNMAVLTKVHPGTRECIDILWGKPEQVEAHITMIAMLACTMSRISSGCRISPCTMYVQHVHLKL